MGNFITHNSVLPIVHLGKSTKDRMPTGVIFGTKSVCLRRTSLAPPGSYRASLAGENQKEAGEHETNGELDQCLLFSGVTSIRLLISWLKTRPGSRDTSCKGSWKAGHFKAIE